MVKVSGWFNEVNTYIASSCIVGSTYNRKHTINRWHILKCIKPICSAYTVGNHTLCAMLASDKSVFSHAAVKFTQRCYSMLALDKSVFSHAAVKFTQRCYSMLALDKSVFSHAAVKFTQRCYSRGALKHKLKAHNCIST